VLFLLGAESWFCCFRWLSHRCKFAAFADFLNRSRENYEHSRIRAVSGIAQINQPWGQKCCRSEERQQVIHLI
jgi:hypothetical protein